MTAEEEEQKSSPQQSSQEDSQSRAQPEDVPTRLSTDKPTVTDALGFRAYASAIAQFLTDDESKPPLTISIQAPWGGGKTSMMLMIEEELDPKAERSMLRESTANLSSKLTVADLEIEVNAQIAGSMPSDLPKLRKNATASGRRTTVWFNAWKYESTSQVWAGLVDAILQQVPMRLGRRERELFWVRLNLSRVDGARIRQSIHEYFIDRVFRTSVGVVWATAAAVVTFLLARLALHTSEPASYSTVLGLVAGVSMKFWLTKIQFANEAVSEMFKNLAQAPAYDKELGFVHQAESDLRRVFRSLPLNEGLVVFIDDLDRCSPMKIAAVLEAVNLIIAGDFPDCFFVLGMDAEMVAAALQVAHKDLIAGAGEKSQIPIGWRFMDKFVQLPFVVPPVDSASARQLLQRLWGVDSESLINEGSEPQRNFGGRPRQDLREFIVLSESLAYLFDGNPRELKRFTNLMRFHWFLWVARQRRSSSSPQAHALAHWTAMSVKWPEHVRWLRRLNGRIPVPRVLDSAAEQPDGVAGQALSQLQGLKHGDPFLNHLRVLEALANAESMSFKQWQEALKMLYDMGDPSPEWVGDSALFSFYRHMSSTLRDTDALSHQVGTGFW